jgi:hypothetical protein
MQQNLIIKEFDLQAINPSSSFIILGPPGSGKSAFTEDLVRKNKHKYPVARIICSAPQPHKRYCEIFPPIFVSSKFDEAAADQFIDRQKRLAATDSKEKYCVYILDDIEVVSRRQFDSPHFNKLCKQGSRHWCLLTVLINQYALDFPPAVRSSASFIVIFRYTSVEDKRKLYQNYGGATIFGSEKMFNLILDEITSEPFTCLVIHQSPNLSKLQDCVFWYKVTKPCQWRFGCNEIWAYSNKRLAESKKYTVVN